MRRSLEKAEYGIGDTYKFPAGRLNSNCFAAARGVSLSDAPRWFAPSCILTGMTADQIVRTTTPDGALQLTATDCRFQYRRVRPGVLLVSISGHDTGQFGAATLDEIRLELLRHRPLELFIDARDAYGAAVNVSDEWTHFFSLNREHLSRVRILVSSQAVYLTVAIAQHLSRTGDLIQIDSDAETFEARLNKPGY